MALFNMTNKSGNTTIKAIVVSDSGFDSCSENIPTDFGTTLFFSGSNDYPVIGDPIFKNSIGTDKWTSSDETQDRRIQIWSRNLKVDSEGITQTTC